MIVMKKLFCRILSCAALFVAGTLAAFDIDWRGDASEALAAPKIQVGAASYRDMPVIGAEAVADGDYQGISGVFSETVDLTKFNGVRFHIRNNFLAEGACVFRLNCRPEGGIAYGIYTNFTVTGDWTEVTIPFNPALWQGPEGKVEFGRALSLSIYPYQAMNRKGYQLEVAGFQFLTPDHTPAPLTVQAYRYINPPDSGDPAGKVLTDGKMDTQAFWRQYSDDAEMIFDLGGIFAVTGIEVAADSIPAHNFSEMRITASIDGKEYYPVAILRNTNTETAAVLHSVRFDGKAIGRYFRFRAVKPRPDFQVHLGEVRFTGYIPSAAEERADAVNRYVLGPDLPPRDSDAYIQARLGDFTLWVAKDNGVINGVRFRDQLWIERLAGRYVRQSRAADRVISAYADRLKDLRVDGGAVSFTVTNPEMPGIELAKRYEIDPTGALLETVQVHAAETLPREFFQVATEVILHPEFRRDGVYETSGAVHAMTRAFAPEIRMETEVCNVPFLSFENAAKNVTLLHERLRANGSFIYFDAVVEESRLLSLLANGWRMPLASGVPADSATQELSGTLRLSVTEGGLLNAYENYLAHPDVAAYRARIHRPAWLRDQLLHGDPGWDGLCRGVSERFYENQKRLFDRGRYVSSARSDLDFVWGEFPTEGVVEDWFGGRQDADGLFDRMQTLRALYPGLKLGLYTWVWSSFPYQKIVREHPDWFVATTRSGAVASWFPGVNTNWLRFWNEASTDEAVTSIMAMVRRYQCDDWYLDGGNAGPYAKDFDRMLLDDPAGQTNFYWRMREAMQEYDPESFLVFNATLNPIADVGILESFSGALTSEWRRGAAWMWKFKMIQYRDPLRYPIYIYWLANVDGAFHNYMLGTGLMPTAISRDVDAGEAPYISARYEVRQLALTDARPLPDWRSDDATETETMTLTQGNAGFVFVNHHGAAGTVTVTVTVGADSAPLGLTDAALPVHAWEMTIRNGKSWKGWWGQPDLAGGYRQSRWIGESALTAQYHGARPRQARLERTFAVEPGQAKMWVISQCPAVIWSLDGLPSQYRIPSTPGAEITGTYPDFRYDTEYADSEIAFLIPSGREVARLLLDGATVPFRYGRDGDAALAIVPVHAAGSHTIQVTLADAPPVTGTPALRLEARIDGSRLAGRVDTDHPGPLTLSIYSDDALCFTDAVTLPGGNFIIDLPVTVKDGQYELVVSDLTGSHRATATMAIAGIGRRTELLELMPYIPAQIAVTPIEENQVGAVATEFTPNAAYASADAGKRQLEVGTLPMIATYYSSAIAGIEYDAKRYLEIELSGNLRYYNLHGQEPKRHFVRIDNPNTVAALMLDFHTPSGYAKRSLAGLGQQYLERGAAPVQWGTGRAPDEFFALCNFIQDSENDTRRFWIDLRELGAPADWDGRLWFTLAFQIGAPNRQLAVRILATADTLPAGAELQQGLNLRASVEQQSFRVQSFPAGTVVTDDWEAPAWQTIAELPKMTQLGTPGVPAPFETRSRVAKDDRNLYLFVRCRDEPGRILETERGAIGQPWFSDSIEFWIQDAPEAQQMLHAVVDAANHAYAEKAHLNKAQVSQSEELKTMPFSASVRKADDHWTILVTLPLAQFQGSPLAFNLMRNRVHQGHLANYTTVPGNNYFCGEVYFLEF